MRLRRSFYGTSVLLLLAFALLAGCSGASTGATSVAVAPAPTATANPTCTVAPATWKVYRGLHFSICYPPEWWYRIDQSTSEKVLVLVSSHAVDTTGNDVANEIRIHAFEFPDANLQDYCHVGLSLVEESLAGVTWQDGNGMSFAGGTWQYQKVRELFRTWQFVTASHEYFAVVAMDANQSQANQAAHDAVLATFRLDDTTPGCPPSA